MKITLKMAPKRKQVVHLKKIAQERKASASQPLPDTTNRVDPDMMVISGLLSGNGYEATKRQALRFNQMTPCKKTFYNHQSKIIKQVNEMVSEDCRNTHTLNALHSSRAAPVESFCAKIFRVITSRFAPALCI